MGLEGAVRLAMARELAALPEDEREATVARHTAEMRTHASALNAARVFEIDDVIDPAETRTVVAATLRAAGGAGGRREDGARGSRPRRHDLGDSSRQI
jgi:acetyl-CoA carboxylase carboxyltransferase component